MTEGQKENVLELYNRAREDMAMAMELMDSKNEKIARKGDERFTEKMAVMETIDRLLDFIGYELVIDDEDIARDIKIKEGR